MALISRFDGIVIQIMAARPFAPRFHAIYGPAELVVQISPPSIVTGDAPPDVREKVLAWAGMHERELLDAWHCCSRARVPMPIGPD